MAKYSKRYNLANSDWGHPKPHILYRDNSRWDYAFTAKKENSGKNDMAEQFCDYLNKEDAKQRRAEARKRGLKA